MFTVSLALIEALCGVVFNHLYLGTFLIDIALIVSIEAMYLAEVKYRNTNEVEK